MNADLLVINCPKHGRTGPLATSVRCGRCAEEDRQELLQLRGTLSLAEEGLANYQWQPIETAPRDGTPVDLWHKVGARIPETWWDAEDVCWSCSMDDSDFTHWMPMPPPPQPEEQT